MELHNGENVGKLLEEISLLSFSSVQIVKKGGENRGAVWRIVSGKGQGD